MPIETEYRLDESFSVTIATGGTATRQSVGPSRPGERWEITNMSVSGTSPAKLQVFRGNSTDRSKQIDVTVTAQADTSDSKTTLRNGETISFLWTGGTVGATMSVHIEGSRFVPGQRAY